MVNISLGSFDDFVKAVRNAPQSVKNILYKAYPQYTKQLQDIYSTVLNNKQAIQPSSTEQPKLTTSKTVNNFSDIANKATNKMPASSKVLSKVAGKTIPYLAALGEVPNVLNKNNPINARVLSGIGIGGMLSGNPIGVGGGALAMLASNIVKNADKNIYSASDKKFQDFTNKYGDATNPNVYNLAPQLRPLTSTQANIVGSNLDLRNLREQLDNTPQAKLISSEAELNENIKATQEAKDRLEYLQSRVANTTQPPNVKLFTDNQINNTMPNTINVEPNTTQINPNINASPIINEAMVTPLTSTQYRQAGLNNLWELNNMNNNVQQNYNPENYKDYLDEYANIAANQLQIANANRQANIKMYQDIINNYNQAVNMDRIQQGIQDIGNSLSNIGAGRRGDVQFIGPQGQMYTIADDDARNQIRNNDINTISNLDNFNNLLNLQQQLAKFNQLPTENFPRELLNAQVLGEMYGVNPALFMTDYGKEIITGQNQLGLENQKLRNELAKLPYQALKELGIEQYKTAADIDKELLKHQNNVAIQNLINQYENSRKYAELMQKASEGSLNRQNQKEIANIYGRNQINAINERAKLNDISNMGPINFGLKAMQAAANYPNPTDAMTNLQNYINYYNTIMGNSTSNVNMPNTSNPSVMNGQITPAGIERMLRYKGMFDGQ